MASQKHLHELLRQDQEPFHLHNYIADRRNSQLNKTKNKPAKSLTKSTTSKRASVYKQACFTSFQDSPDLINSPLKKKHSGTVLHVPAKTAAGLLEAATKIHNQSASSKPKNVRFAGLFFGSILRKLKDKNTSTSKTRELSSSSINGPTFEAKQDQFVVDNSRDKYEMGFAFSDCNYSNISRRISITGWSESNTPEEEEEEDNKSIDMDTISSCTTSRSDYYNQDFVLPNHPHFCFSPVSPFRFALHRSPSVGRRTPDFLSPSASPCCHLTQEDDDQATENSQNQTQEEDEKDQCSPVSVLDLPFEDDEREDGREEEEEDEYDYDRECSYALMQKAKFQLLEKLRRFERLAELEPIELEKRMLEGYEDEDEDDYDYSLDENEEHEEVDEFSMNVDDLICEIFSRSSPCNLEKVPGHMRRLVLDLIAEEKKNGMGNKTVAMVQMVCKRLDSWKEVEPNTIDMMVELDLRREVDEWKSYEEEEVRDRAKEIELAIFGLLMEEISEELVAISFS